MNGAEHQGGLIINFKLTKSLGPVTLDIIIPNMRIILERSPRNYYNTIINTNFGGTQYQSDNYA